jgi:hypothetical protein
MILIEVVGDNQTFFRTISETDLRDIARTFAVDKDLQKAHDNVWDWSQPASIASTGNVEHSVIDDSTDLESCHESWLEIHEAFEGE